MTDPSNETHSQKEQYQHVLDTARRLLIENQALSGRLHHMQRVVTALNRAVTLDEALAAITTHVHWLFKFDHCSVCVQRPDGEWELKTLVNEGDRNASVFISAEQDGLNDGVSSSLSEYASQIIIPLENESETLGMLNFASHEADAFSLEDRRTANLLAAQLANGLRNIRLLEEARRARQESEQYLAKLEAGTSELDDYSYAVAHDLKSPLHVLHGYVSLLQLILSDHDNPEVQTYLTEVDHASKNMARIIDQLLWLAQLNNARTVAVPVDMSSAAHRSLWRFMPEIKQRQVAIDIADDMPPALAQEGWIEEVFANLISNAIKYMGDDNPRPHIEVRGVLDGGTADGAVRMARYEVADNGVGIAQLDQSRIFQMFTRLRFVDAEGHGLGLSIVSRIVQRLGGQIGVRSAPGVGSTFWFTLPAA